MASVVLDHVSVSYGRQAALRDVSAVFPSGAVGLLGPNGAGKSTMLKSLLGFITPTAGRLEVLGLDVADRAMDIRARLGYMPETDGHVPGMNAVHVRRLLWRARRAAEGRRDAACPRGPVLRWPRRGALPERRDATRPG